MCGIAGIYRFDGADVDVKSLSAMGDLLSHRGPDDSGVWVSGAVGLAHTRLSIIDLASSRQPMSGTGDRVHVVFNGEILNYRQLRTSLQYPFQSGGDTETLLALYDRFGIEGVDRLRGQFAYALHDSRSGDVHLVRDRLGILPLYYFHDEHLFAFASESKALLAIMRDAQVDIASLDEYLAHRSVPAPNTLIKGVRKVPQGSTLTVSRDGRISTRSYWQLSPGSKPLDVTPAESVDLVAAALRAAVDDALVADVPVGAYLSGGVDSSLISALVAESRHGEGLHTFSAGFGDSRVDEVHWARRVAGIIGSDHHEVTVTADDFRECWSRLSWHRDAPLSEPADVAVFRLAELARRDVKVVLSGEGSDELFGGYPKYGYAGITRWCGLVPTSIRGSLLRAADRVLPASQARVGIAMRALAEPSFEERMRSWFAPFNSRDRRALLGHDPVRDGLSPYERARGDALRRMLYADVHTWLADNLLERGDRMSMAASLELRPPFLDHRLVELAFSLPSSVKVRRRQTKWIVKEVTRRYLPDEIVDRPKVGFRVPLDSWFHDRGGLKHMASDLLTGPDSFVGDVLDRPSVHRLLTSHDSGHRDEQSRLWTLLSLEVWHREFRQMVSSRGSRARILIDGRSRTAAT